MEVISERISDLRRTWEVLGIGTAAAKGLVIRTIPIAATPRPRRAEIAPIREVGVTGYACSVAPTGPKAKLFDESFVTDLIVAIKAEAFQRALIMNPVINQEPIE